MSAPEPYYWGKHRLVVVWMDSVLLLRKEQTAARADSGLTALLADRARLGPVGRHTDPRDNDDLDAQSIERCTAASLAAVQETQQ